MTLFFLILKITGMILLSLLGLIMILILLLLFAPITYRVKGSCHDRQWRLHIRAAAFLYFVGFYYDMEPGTKGGGIRIAGIPKSLESNKKQNTENTKERKEVHSAKPRQQTDSSFHQKSFGSASESTRTSERDDKTPEENTTVLGKIKSTAASVKLTVKNLWHMLTHMRQTLRDLLDTVNDETTKEAVRVIVRKILALLGKMVPRKFRLSLSFSSGSPDTTGILMGFLAMFPVGYNNRWKITPDFTAEEAYVETDFDIRGHLFGIQILTTALGIILDKNCRKLYNKFR